MKFEGLMEGGGTKPWEVTVKTDNGLVPYVIKLYKNESFYKTNPARNDILASVLATECSLTVPSFSFISLTEEFIQTLPEQEKFQLAECDNRPKFGTRLIKPYYPYSVALRNSELKIFDLESVYAFDNLILNFDRREEKSNIIFSDSDYFLIDHELSLQLREGDNDIELFLKRGNYPQHLFYKRLRQLAKRRDFENFNTFHEHLRHLNVTILNKYYDALDEHGYETDDCFRLTNYLLNIKRNSSNFIKALNETLK